MKFTQILCSSLKALIRNHPQKLDTLIFEGILIK